MVCILCVSQVCLGRYVFGPHASLLWACVCPYASHVQFDFNSIFIDVISARSGHDFLHSSVSFFCSGQPLWKL